MILKVRYFEDYFKMAIKHIVSLGSKFKQILTATDYQKREHLPICGDLASKMWFRFTLTERRVEATVGVLK